MAMGIKRSKAEINVTPMIDVLLVLLIIFMVVLPEHSVGAGCTGAPARPNQGRPLPSQDIVLTVLGGGKVRLNQSDLDVADLPDRLHALLIRYSPGVAFVKGEDRARLRRKWPRSSTSPRAPAGEESACCRSNPRASRQGRGNPNPQRSDRHSQKLIGDANAVP